MSGGSRAARIISISWFLPVPNELCQRASAASVGRCLEGASPGSVHHQHQLEIASPQTARGSAHHQHQLDIACPEITRAVAHHQHQLDIACPKKALPGHMTSTSCAVAARAMHIISISCILHGWWQPGSARHQHQLVFASPELALAMRISSIN